MMAFILLSTLTPPPVNLDALSVERATEFHGRLVLSFFVVGKPSFTWKGRTVLGAADRDDGVERTVIGKGLDAKQGKRVHVLGRLRVIRHPGYVVNGVIVSDWSEIRVEQ